MPKRPRRPAFFRKAGPRSLISPKDIFKESTAPAIPLKQRNGCGKRLPSRMRLPTSCSRTFTSPETEFPRVVPKADCCCQRPPRRASPTRQKNCGNSNPPAAASTFQAYSDYCSTGCRPRSVCGSRLRMLRSQSSNTSCVGSSFVSASFVPESEFDPVPESEFVVDDA